MKASHRYLALLVPAIWYAATVAAPAASILTPADTIFTYGLDTRSDYPGGESPPNVLDGDAGSKYLNFGQRNSGVIFTPTAGAATARSFVLTTANDATERDPASYLLFGTNNAITSTNPGNTNINGLGVATENWTLIGNGTLSLPNERTTLGAPVNIGNPGLFSAYWMVFPTVRDEGMANSMQLADIRMFDGVGGTGSEIDVGTPAVGTCWDSDFPSGEAAPNAIDGDPNTKLLNFGRERTGVWVVPAVGASTVRSFSITTANDWEERDPASYRLLGQAADGTWNLVGEGPLALPSDRWATGPQVPLTNDTAFYAYRLEFPTLKNADATNSMQIAEIQFFDVIPEPSALLLAAGTLVGLLARRRRR